MTAQPAQPGKSGKSMDAKARAPKTESRKFVVPGKNPKGTRYGKLQPRDRPSDRVAPARYVKTCIACGHPRDLHGPVVWLRCAQCAPSEARS